VLFALIVIVVSFVAGTIQSKHVGGQGALGLFKDQGGLIQHLVSQGSAYSEDRIGIFSDLDCQPSQGTNCHCIENQMHVCHLGCSPVNVRVLHKCLKTYTNRSGAGILIRGFMYGSKTEYTGPRASFECRNLKSAFDHKTE
jgi:hypothetical protein